MSDQQSARDVGDARLEPIRVWAKENHGAIQRLTRWLQRRTGETITRQTVGRWLDLRPDKRQQPQYGWGLLLEEGYKALAAE